MEGWKQGTLGEVRSCSGEGGMMWGRGTADVEKRERNSIEWEGGNKQIN